MPWSIVKDHSECPTSEPYAVVKDSDGSVEGCHETRDDAEAHMAALYANEPDAEEAAVTVFDEITRLVFQDEGCPPGHHAMPGGECMPDEEMGGKPSQGTDKDKRLKRNKKAGTQTAELAALTAELSIIDETVEAQTELERRALAALSPVEEEVDSIPNTVPWKGPMVVEDERTGDGRQFAAGSLTWPDPVDVNMALQWQKETSHGGINDVTVNVGRITEVWRDGNTVWGRGYVDMASEDGQEIARRMKLHEKLGVSIVADDPENEEIELVYPEGCSDGGIPMDIDELMEADANCFWPETTIFHSGRIRALTAVDVPAFVGAWISLDEETADKVEHLVAAAHLIAIPDVPPAEWFTEPTELPAIGALTVTDDGRVYGYLAPRHVAHRGFPDRRIEVPMRNVDYDTWANRPTIVQGGERIATGPITMDCGHADPLPWVTGEIAREHYDNSCSLVATVAIGENDRGVWIAGALLHDVTAAQVARMLACQLSGDWRPHRERPGMREFSGALLVPQPGFPMANPRFSMRLDHGQLVASTVPVRQEHSVSPVLGLPTWDEVKAALAAKTASASVEEVEEARSLARELERGTLVPTT